MIVTLRTHTDGVGLNILDKKKNAFSNAFKY